MLTCLFVCVCVFLNHVAERKKKVFDYCREVNKPFRVRFSSNIQADSHHVYCYIFHVNEIVDSFDVI